MANPIKIKTLQGQNAILMPATQQPPLLERPELRVFLTLLQQLQKLDPEFPLQYSICLAEIAMSEGMSLTNLSEKTGLALSTVSRIVGALSKYRQNGQPYGLVEIRVSEEERRRKELYLTQKGWDVIESIEDVLSSTAT